MQTDLSYLKELVDKGDLTKAVMECDKLLMEGGGNDKLSKIRNEIISRIRQVVDEIELEAGDNALAKFSLPPARAHLDVGNGCNLRCVYCWEATRPDHLKIISTPTEELKSKLRWMKDIGVKVARISGFGEVTIMPNWAEVVAYAQELGLKTGLITNLSKRLSDAEVEILSNVDEITVSVDTLNVEKSLSIRKGLRVQVLLDNLKAIRQLKPYPSKPVIGWNTVTMIETLDDIVDLVEQGIELGAHGFMFNSMFVLQGVEGVSPIAFLSSADLKQAARIFQDASELARKAGRYAIIDSALTELFEGPESSKLQDTNSVRFTGKSIGTSNQNQYTEGYFEPVAEGKTRLCLHPWNHLTLMDRTKVSVCCEVGGVELSKECDYSSGEMLELKEGLLTGNLVQNCQKCRLAPEVPVEAQQYSVARLFNKSKLYKK